MRNPDTLKLVCDYCDEYAGWDCPICGCDFCVNHRNGYGGCSFCEPEKMTKYNNYYRCMSDVCKVQFAKIIPPSSNVLYDFYKKCPKCGSLWSKMFEWCECCGCMLRSRPRHLHEYSKHKYEKTYVRY